MIRTIDLQMSVNNLEKIAIGMPAGLIQLRQPALAALAAGETVIVEDIMTACELAEEFKERAGNVALDINFDQANVGGIALSALVRPAVEAS